MATRLQGGTRGRTFPTEELLRLGWRFAPDEGASGGSDEADEPEVDADEPIEFGEEPADEPEEDADGAGAPGTPEGPASPDPAPQSAKVEPTDEELAALLARRGFTLTRADAEPVEHLGPRQQAIKEAEAAGKGDDLEWIDNRAFEIIEERTRVQQTQAAMPIYRQEYAERLKASSTPEYPLEEILDDYMTAMQFHGPDTFTDQSPQGLQRRQSAFIWALGQREFRKYVASAEKHAAAPKGKAEDDEPALDADKPAIGNPSAARLPQFAPDVKSFLNDWAKVHNGGKFPDAKQINALKKEYPAIFE